MIFTSRNNWKTNRRMKRSEREGNNTPFARRWDWVELYRWFWSPLLDLWACVSQVWLWRNFLCQSSRRRRSALKSRQAPYLDKAVFANMRFIGIAHLVRLNTSRWCRSWDGTVIRLMMVFIRRFLERSKWRDEFFSFSVSTRANKRKQCFVFRFLAVLASRDFFFFCSQLAWRTRLSLHIHTP